MAQDVNLSPLSEGELMELIVPTPTLNRRVLVMWLYLNSKSSQPLEQFDSEVSTLAEKELQKRASSGI